MTTKTKRIPKPPIDARVLEVLEDRAIVAADPALMSGFRKLGASKQREVESVVPGQRALSTAHGETGDTSGVLPFTIRGCKPCREALCGLRGEPGLTPREQRLGTRVVDVRREWRYHQGRSVEKLVTRCGTCGHKMKAFARDKIADALWSAVPAAAKT